MKLSVLYRGPLSSCNYACRYCPFAKRTETRTQLRQDRHSLFRFTSWIRAESRHAFKVLLTPWGEALVRRCYRDAIVELSHVEHVRTVSIQTNLSAPMQWVDQCRRERITFCATYHPSEVDLAAFASKVKRLHAAGVVLCVGAVAVPEFLPQIAELRRMIPPEIYVWINAQQPRPREYTEEEQHFLSAIDPLFMLTAKRHASRHERCYTGETVFTVDGHGDMRRCHFVDRVIGNIFRPDWPGALKRRRCPNLYCDCYLGFAHLATLRLNRYFGDGLLERIPPRGKRLDRAVILANDGRSLQANK